MTGKRIGVIAQGYRIVTEYGVINIGAGDADYNAAWLLVERIGKALVLQIEVQANTVSVEGERVEGENIKHICYQVLIATRFHVSVATQT